jgi:hypothetical protein
MREYFNVKMCLCFTQHTCVFSVSCLGDAIEKGELFGSLDDSANFLYEMEHMSFCQQVFQNFRSTLPDMSLIKCFREAKR